MAASGGQSPIRPGTGTSDLSLHLDFLRNLQRLLDEGVFTATYKYALLRSLADLAVEREADEDGSLRIAVADIAEKFIQYYWRQTAPYRGTNGILKQNAGRQAAIVNHVAEARASYQGSLPAARRDDAEWRGLRSKVSAVIRQMPLWKLQVVAGQAHEFLYRKAEYEAGTIRLLPEAVACLRDMYVIVTNFIKGAWVTRVQSFGFNRDLLGDMAELPEFLFGSDRHSLEKYRVILQEYQESRCFYCGRKSNTGELDHFIPWSRYSVDLGHNFVFSHARCNLKKSDFLAGVEHLAKWKENNIDEPDALSGTFAEAGLAHDKTRSTHVTIWAYEQGEAAGGHVWVKGDQVEQLSAAWRRVFT